MTEPYCECGGRCHHSEAPCSLGCWSAQKPWRVEEAYAALREAEAREARLIERDARLEDALDALRAAVLWLHGDYRDVPRSQFNAEGWYRKAHSGIVGLVALAKARNEVK